MLLSKSQYFSSGCMLKVTVSTSALWQVLNSLYNLHSFSCQLWELSFSWSEKNKSPKTDTDTFITNHGTGMFSAMCSISFVIHRLCWIWVKFSILISPYKSTSLNAKFVEWMTNSCNSNSSIGSVRLLQSYNGPLGCFSGSWSLFPASQFTEMTMSW